MVGDAVTATGRRVDQRPRRAAGARPSRTLGDPQAADVRSAPHRHRVRGQWSAPRLRRAATTCVSSNASDSSSATTRHRTSHVDGRTRRWRAAAVGFSPRAGRPMSDSDARERAVFARRAAGRPDRERAARAPVRRTRRRSARPSGRTRPSSPTTSCSLTPDELAGLVTAIDELLRPHRVGVKRDAARSVDAHRSHRRSTPSAAPTTRHDAVTAPTTLGVAPARLPAGVGGRSGERHRRLGADGRACRCTSSPRRVRARPRPCCSCASWSSPPCSGRSAAASSTGWNLRRCLIVTNLPRRRCCCPCSPCNPTGCGRPTSR